MHSRYKQTASLTEHPVKFYKFIALTFLCLTVVLLSVIMFMSSKRATITIESKATPIDITDSVLIGNGNMSGSVKGIVVSKVIALSEIFVPTGTREEESLAGGVVILSNDSKVAQTLVATTRLLSSENVLFRIKNKVTIPAEGTIEVEVYADEKGAGGNISADKFTIPGLTEAKQKEIYATSEESMTGGVKQLGILSAEDMDRATEKLRTMLKEKGMNELSSDNLGMASVFSLTQERFESETKIGDEISEFVLTGKAEVVGVFYNAEEMQRLAEKILEKRGVDDVEMIQANNQPPTVIVEEYDLTKGTATVQVFHSGSAVLNPESKQLDKAVFFGKTKDEVRRYLLKLDHVRSVEIKFTPAWVRSIPFVAEHVNVIVKEIK